MNEEYKSKAGELVAKVTKLMLTSLPDCCGVHAEITEEKVCFRYFFSGGKAETLYIMLDSILEGRAYGHIEQHIAGSRNSIAPVELRRPASELRLLAEAEQVCSSFLYLANGCPWKEGEACQHHKGTGVCSTVICPFVGRGWATTEKCSEDRIAALGPPLADNSPPPAEPIRRG